MTYRHSISPRHCKAGLNTTDFMSLESTLLSIVGPRWGEFLFCLACHNKWIWKFRILGAWWCACWNLEMVSVDKFSQVREDLFPAQSLEKKRHLLEHDKHLATALWLMGPKTEVSSVHFQHWLIYSHFSLLHVLGGWQKDPPSPLTDGQYWMQRPIQFMQANTGTGK